VLDGLVAGKSNKTIAYDLSLSPRMIEGYRAGLMTKLEAGVAARMAAEPEEMQIPLAQLVLWKRPKAR